MAAYALHCYSPIHHVAVSPQQIIAGHYIERTAHFAADWLWYSRVHCAYLAHHINKHAVSAIVLKQVACCQ